MAICISRLRYCYFQSAIFVSIQLKPDSSFQESWKCSSAVLCFVIIIRRAKGYILLVIGWAA